MTLPASAYAQSRQGLHRNENQDHFGLDEKQGLYVVSDGMGGHAEGGLASRMVVKAILEDKPEPGATRAASATAQLRARVLKAHQQTAELASKLGHRQDMGATVVCLWLQGRRYLVAAVGDSRVYLWRQGKLMQLNEDHTLMQSYLKQGMLSRAEAARHPQRHVLTQAMGVGEVVPDLFQGDLEPGDRFLLASDGVHGVLAEVEMAQALEQATDPRQAVEAILSLVEAKQGDDDATALVVFV